MVNVHTKHVIKVRLATFIQQICQTIALNIAKDTKITRLDQAMADLAYSTYNVIVALSLGHSC
eukprot:3612066-Amphidinium_carterae.1